MAEERETAFPEWGIGGLPGGDATKFLRVDFGLAGGEKYSTFDSFIETKTPRLVWARAARCPCVGFNDQTQQTDPTCPLCNATGWAYFKPRQYAFDEKQLGTLDALQKSILEKANGVVIRGLMTSVAVQPDMFQALGANAMGSAMLTVRPANRVGYYDRIIAIDEVMPHSEVVVVDGATLKTRYPVRWLNACFSTTKGYADEDIALFEDGTLGWRTGKKPANGTRVAVHYMKHPQWIVMEYANLVRTSLIKFRRATSQTPDGDILDLPIKTLVRLEHLVDLGPEQGAPEPA